MPQHGITGVPTATGKARKIRKEYGQTTVESKPNVGSRVGWHGCFDVGGRDNGKGRGRAIECHARGFRQSTSQILDHVRRSSCQLGNLSVRMGCALVRPSDH